MVYKTNEAFIERMLSEKPLQQTELYQAEAFLLKTAQLSPMEYGLFFSYLQNVYKTRSTKLEALITALALFHKLATKDMIGFYILLQELGNNKDFLCETVFWKYTLNTASFFEQGLYHKIYTQIPPSDEFTSFLSFFGSNTSNTNKEIQEEKKDSYWCGIDLCLSIVQCLEKEV